MFLLNKNILKFLIASEFMFLGIDTLFIGSALILNEKFSLLYAILILMLTVGESAVGLGLCVLSLKLKTSIQFINYSSLKY